MKHLLQRFWSKVEKHDPVSAACWNWKSFVNKQNGYGRFWFRNRSDGAHRVSYILMNGEIPKHLEIDHLCRNRKCVKPTHLRLVTKKVNILAGVGASAKNKRKDNCPNGHQFDFIEKTKARICRVCAREKARIYWHERKHLVNPRRRKVVLKLKEAV